VSGEGASSGGTEVWAKVAPDRCVGIGMCMVEAPRGFDFGDDQLSVFQPNSGATEQELIAAADACPSSAISVLRAARQLR
jgi:ferredoxin